MYSANNILRLADTTQTAAALTNPQYTEFTALLGGTSGQYTKANTNGTIVPSLGTAPTTHATGQIWFDTGTGKFEYWDGTAVQTVGTGAGSVTGVTATLPLSSTGGTTPVISFAGLSALGTANQVFGMNNAATAAEYKSIVGTANQVSVTHSANTITLATPQSINTSASPTFAGLTLSGLGAGAVSSSAGGVLSSGTLSVGNGGTGATSFGVNRIVKGNGLIATSALTYDTCTIGQILQFNSTDWVCTTLSTTAFLQGGNSFAATAVLGTLDANPLQFVTGANGPNTRMTITPGGNDRTERSQLPTVKSKLDLQVRARSGTMAGHDSIIYCPLTALRQI